MSDFSEGSPEGLTARFNFFMAGSDIRDRIGDPRFWYQGFFARNFLDFLEIFRVIFWIFLASPGPGVAGNGFSAKNHSQFRGRDANPCPEDPFRGDFPFLEQKKLGTKVFGVFIPWAPPRAQNSENLGLGPWFFAERCHVSVLPDVL